MHSTVEGKYHWIRYWYHGLQLVSIDAYCLNISYLNWLLAMMVCNWLVLVLTHLLREALVRWLEMLISLSSNYSAYLLRPSVTFFFLCRQVLYSSNLSVNIHDWDLAFHVFLQKLCFLRFDYFAFRKRVVLGTYSFYWHGVAFYFLQAFHWSKKWHSKEKEAL